MTKKHNKIKEKEMNTQSVVNEDLAVCARCNAYKNKSEFYTRRNGKPLSYCINCQKEVKELKLQENLERVIEERCGCCCDCEMVYPLPVYEFYKDGKVYQISKAKNMSLKKIKEELYDYTMLCRNCSAIRRWEL